MSNDSNNCNTNNKEAVSDINKIPSTCGDCGRYSFREEYSHYDDLEGWDVYEKTMTCNVNHMTIGEFRTEGSLRFDYGYEDYYLGKRRPDNCPLCQK